jgi:hypothetical protein
MHRAEVNVNIVATYIKFLECKTLMMIKSASIVGRHWQRVAMIEGMKEHYEAEEWIRLLGKLRDRLVSLPPAKRVHCEHDQGALDIDKIVYP